jgi:hypothetical protein
VVNGELRDMTDADSPSDAVEEQRVTAEQVD